jgi:PPOX class probable FMN-dependent enzyme
MDGPQVSDAYAITSLEQLAAIYKTPHQGAILKVTDHVSEPGRAFIARAPFLILATSGADGLDCSPKGDAPGFVHLADDRTLLIPDRPGNNRIDGMKNILANPEVGVIFMIPGAHDTYRVNGTASISVAPDLLSRLSANGKPPRAVIVVKVRQAFNHCPKALVRSKLWQVAAEGRPDGVPTLGNFAVHRDGGDAAAAAQYDEAYAKRMPGELY